MKKRSFYQLSFEDLQHELVTQGLNPVGARELYLWHYRRKNPHPCSVNLALKTQAFLDQNFDFELPQIKHVHQSEDGTVKFLFKLADGQHIESVLIPFLNKYSLCLSSQVGCAMNCSFCYTGTMGLKRHLDASEITGQYIQVGRWKKENLKEDKRSILSLVFMGQGEPLHNFDAVKKACEIFLSPYGATFAIQKITISTAGHLPGLKRWRKEMPGVNIALSLHSPLKSKRDELIPINRRFDLAQVIAELDQIPLKKKQFVTYEYLLIKDFNDSLEDAHQTAELLASRRAMVNIIPFNPFPGSRYQRPDAATTKAFIAVLESYQIPTMLRTTKGDDILAACGQLNTVLSRPS